MGEVILTRRFEFAASHRYAVGEWSEEENLQVFGACAYPYGHGHNYVLEVQVAGTPDAVTGMVLNLVDLKVIVEEILTEFDHKNLNEDLPYFQNLVPTTENIARVLWDLIEAKLPHQRLHALRLHEDEDLYVEYLGEGS